MGFSVSASVAIIFAATLIAFGMFHTAAFNTVERVTDARNAAEDDLLTQQNTAIAVHNATYYDANNSLIVTVNNTGASELTVDGTDLIVDNDYQTSFAERSVDGDTGTGLWLPGEQLRYNVSATSQPDRIKIVSGPGVASTEVVVRG
ncbi:flagellin [Halorhabdus sp. CBA1104]|uniref:flagellin n=1 Tax=unclassified Halorhabdus TaxID=2621901 RepID=UPI0012B2F32A|nr:MULTISPECIES: flagellin [unclassified Halorhabdus]QGN07193.1 flagellin [Halorhabdus sp. CBA1104]